MHGTPFLTESRQSPRIIIGRLEHGSDLAAGIEKICREHDVRAGWVSVIGAVSCAELGYYDQSARRYAPPHRLDGAHEIASCSGNVSTKDGSVFVHLHAVLTDAGGRAFGGHVLGGTKVFAAEFVIRVFTDVVMQRFPDEVTGLSLWRDHEAGDRQFIL